MRDAKATQATRPRGPDGKGHLEPITKPGAAWRLRMSIWHQWSFDDSWLLSEANRFERELNILVAAGSAKKKEDEVALIRGELEDARCIHLDRQARWAAIHHAEEMSIGFLDEGRLTGLAERLVHTAESENFPAPLMTLIRHLTVQSACVTGSRANRLSCGRVREAMEESHAYFRYVYRANSLTSRWRVLLLCFGIASLGAMILIAEKDDSISGSLEWSLPIGYLTVLAGVLGAVTSAIQRLARDPVQGTVPARVGSFTAVGTRVFVGAVAGLTAYAAAFASLGDNVDSGLAITLLAAFGAGFAERLATISQAA